MIIVTCYSTSLAFQSLLNNFNTNCISGANISFTDNPPLETKLAEVDKSNEKLDEQFKEFQSFHIDPITQKPIGEDDNKPQKKHIFAFLEKEKVLPMSTTTETSNLNDTKEVKRSEKVHFLSRNDTKKFKECKRMIKHKHIIIFAQLNQSIHYNNYSIVYIDENNSTWGHYETCSYYYHIPIVEAIVAVVWVVFIIISGHRGDRLAKM